MSPSKVDSSTFHCHKPRFPFQDLDADVVLKSSDGVEFRTYKLLLFLSSSTFKSFFASQKYKTRLQVIELDASAEVLEALLARCDPRALHSCITPRIEAIAPTVRLAQKYRMDLIVPPLLLNLQSYVTESPLRVYAIACHGLKVDDSTSSSLMRSAALELLRHKLEPMLVSQDAKFPEMENLPSKYITALTRFHRKCGKVAQHLTIDPSWCISNRVMRKGIVAYDGDHQAYTFEWLPAMSLRSEWVERSSFRLPPWWWNFIDALGKELLSTPRPNQIADLIQEAHCPMNYKLPKEPVSTDIKLSLFYHNMGEFLAVLGEEINRAVSKIMLEVDVC